MVESMSTNLFWILKSIPKPDMEHVLFEAVPFEVLKHASNCSRLPFCIVVAGVPCCLTLHLFESLDILLPVRVGS